MATERLEETLAAELADIEREGRRKAAEPVTTAVLPPEGDRGPRYLLEGGLACDLYAEISPNPRDDEIAAGRAVQPAHKMDPMMVMVAVDAVIAVAAVVADAVDGGKEAIAEDAIAIK